MNITNQPTNKNWSLPITLALQMVLVVLLMITLDGPIPIFYFLSYVIFSLLTGFLVIGIVTSYKGYEDENIINTRKKSLKTLIFLAVSTILTFIAFGAVDTGGIAAALLGIVFIIIYAANFLQLIPKVFGILRTTFYWSKTKVTLLVILLVAIVPIIISIFIISPFASPFSY